MARKMKDSGIEWIGEIPEEWETGKVKKYYNIQIGFTPDTKNELLYDDTNGYDWVNISDMIDGQTIINTKKKISQYYIEICKPKIIPKGSLMYSFKLSVGQTAYAGKNIYSNEAIASFLPSETVNLFFLRYSSIFIILNAQTNIYNAKILNQDLIKNAYVIFPTLDEQQRIADFLDQKCAQIDEILQKTRDTIAEYKKLKQSIITQAVTKGVRGKRPMKDSGIEWIGEIPEEWEIRKGKTILTILERPVRPDDRVITCFRDGEVTLRSNRREDGFTFSMQEAGYQGVEQGDLVVHGMDGFAGAIGISDSRGKATPVLNVLNTNQNKRYIMYYLRNMAFVGVFQSLSTGIRIRSCDTNWNKLKILSYLIPLQNEQQEIVAYLDQKCAEIDKLIEKKEQLVSELESYKKSLIYEYVTGKKEVVI